MKLYSDIDLTKEVKTLDFGIVLAGDTKKIEYYLYNDALADVVELEPSVEQKDVTVVAYPQELKSHGKASIIVSWTPAITLKQGLKAQLNLKFYELYE